MLKYNGSDIYTFHNQHGHPITLTKEDINTICDLAMKDDTFDIGEEVAKLADDNKHWRELHAELKENFEQLKNDILNIINRNK